MTKKKSGLEMGRASEHDRGRGKLLLLGLLGSLMLYGCGGVAPKPQSLTGWTLVIATEATMAPFSTVSTTAQCPTGKVVTGGGGAAGPFGRIISAKPLADGTGFVALGYNDHLLDSSRVSAFAICIDRPADYKVVEATKTLQRLQRGTVRATCPAGTVLLGGGAEGSTDTYLASSAPEAGGGAWAALLRNDLVLPGSDFIRSYATCASDTVVTGREVIVSPSVQIGPGSESEFRIKCSPGKKALGLGYSTQTTLLAQGWFQYVPANTRSLLPPDSWWGFTGNKSNLLDNVTLDVSMIAVCAIAG
jgi:hypothetical protein